MHLLVTHLLALIRCDFDRMRRANGYRYQTRLAEFQHKQRPLRKQRQDEEGARYKSRGTLYQKLAGQHVTVGERSN